VYDISGSTWKNNLQWGYYHRVCFGAFAMGRPPKPPKTEPVVLPSTFVPPSREELMEDVQGTVVRAFQARSEYVRQEAE